MGETVQRSFTTAGGSRIEADGGNIRVTREVPKPTDPHGVEAACLKFEAAAKTGDKKKLQAASEDVRSAVNASKRGDFSAAHLLPLVRAGEEAARKNDYSILELILSCLALGIPFIVDAANDTDAERVLDFYEKMADVDRFEAQMLKPGIDGDISAHMNLFVGEALKESTSAAASLGAPFPEMRDQVARHSYSANATIDPKNFEESAGVMLTHGPSGALLSKDGDRLALLRYNGRAVYEDGNGALRDNKTHRLLENVDRAMVTKEVIAWWQVGVRFREEGDPERTGMPFPWRGHTDSVNVGWWGQCHASGMLGAMGFSPAKADVSYFDEATGKKVELNADQVTSLLVLYGDRAFFEISRPAGAGGVNRSETRLDRDKPEVFHEFVQRQIAANMPFNLEAYSYDQIWNYPVAAAAIKAEKRERKLFGGFDTQYEMTLTTSDGTKRRYFYTISTNRDGKITGSSWDTRRAAIANKAHTEVVPDMLTAYLDGGHPVNVLSPTDQGGDHGVPFGFDERAQKVIIDLYFGSRAATGDHAYLVRKKDGRLESVSKLAFSSLR